MYFALQTITGKSIEKQCKIYYKKQNKLVNKFSITRNLSSFLNVLYPLNIDHHICYDNQMLFGRASESILDRFYL
jgi:hypothetical protein